MADSSARTVGGIFFRALVRSELVVNLYRRAAPAEDFHIRNLDVAAPEYPDRNFLGRLLAPTRALNPEA
jgi:hypothetical protein